MNQFYQKEIGGILGAVLLSASPVFASPIPGYSPSYPNKWDRVRLADSYQEGYSTTRKCYREQYREEYVPGTKDNPGYIKSWTDTIEYPCRRTRIERTPDNINRTRTYEEYDNNDCSDGKIAGALLGGGAAAAMSRGDGRWWAIPLGAVVGGTIGCDIDGG
tara:strand:- start:123 stop:605 length:483 start_codon:yes stop_codon:yes gene_type:complete